MVSPFNFKIKQRRYETGIVCFVTNPGGTICHLCKSIFNLNQIKISVQPRMNHFWSSQAKNNFQRERDEQESVARSSSVRECDFCIFKLKFLLKIDLRL